MISRIRKIHLFSQLPEQDLEDMIRKREVNRKKYYQGQTVYDEQDLCTSFDVVLSGSLVAYTLAESGSTMTMFEFKKNQMLGANLLFGDTNTFPFSIYAMKDSEILHVSKDAVALFLHEYDFALGFVRLLSLNSQKLNQKITMVMHRTLRENILDYLHQQSVLQGSREIQLPMSKKQLADYLGVQRPSLFRELKKLKEEGVLEVSNRRITLK